jgi:hypothetical protein
VNGKKAKRIRRQAKEMLVGWLHTQVDKEDHDKITTNNILSKLSKQTHFFLQGKMTLAPYSFKWAIKQIKKNEFNG